MEARREDGQALLLALGGAFALIVAALALVAIAGAITGKGRAQRAADLAAISAARSMRDDLPRLLAPPTLPNGLPNPAHMEKVVYLARARTAAIDVARGNGVAPERLRSLVSRRGLVRPAAGEGGGDRRRRTGTGSRRRPSPKRLPPRAPRGRCRRPRAAAATAVRSSTATARACAPTSPLPSTACRPPLRTRGSRSSSTRASAPTPNRRRSSPPIPTPGGWRRPVTRCTAARPSSTSGRNRRTAGWPRTPRASASSSATRGRAGTTASTGRRLHVRRPGTPSGRTERGAGETVPSPPAPGCRRSSRRASALPCCAPPPAGTSPPLCSPRN